VKIDVSRRDVAVGIAILLGIIGFLIPFVVLGVSDSYEVQYVGVPVTDSAFANLTSTAYDTVMLPGGVIDTSQESVRMELNYTGLGRVNLTTAEQEARSFISGISYLEGFNFSLNQDLIFNDSLHCILGLRFEDGNLLVNVEVNSLTGRVMGFSPLWAGETTSPYSRDENQTSYLPTDSIEESAIRFLRTNNYTLSQFCRYAGPSVESSITFLTYYAYSLRFFCVVNRCIVEDNLVSIDLDPLTGDPVSFEYQWTYIPELPTDNSIGPRRAETEASIYLGLNAPQVTSARVVSSVMVFANIDQEFVLCWVVSIEAVTEFEIYVDAVNASVLMMLYHIWLSTYIAPEYSRANDIFLILALSTVVASAAYLVVRRICDVFPRNRSGMHVGPISQ